MQTNIWKLDIEKLLGLLDGVGRASVVVGSKFVHKHVFFFFFRSRQHGRLMRSVVISLGVTKEKVKVQGPLVPYCMNKLQNRAAQAV